MRERCLKVPLKYLFYYSENTFIDNSNLICLSLIAYKLNIKLLFLTDTYYSISYVSPYYHEQRGSTRGMSIGGAVELLGRVGCLFQCYF